MQNQSNVAHLNNLCIVHADFDIWSAQARLTPDDLKLGVGGEIPPERLAQLGTKRICSSEKLKGFHRLKSAARRALARYGMPFLNGFAVPVSKLDEVHNYLREVEVEFRNLVDDFINDYSAAIDEWCVENKEYEASIRAAALPQMEVKKRLGFDFQVFMCAPMAADQAAAERLATKVSGLGDDLLAEVNTEASDFFHERLAGKTACGISTKKTLTNLRAKLEGLAFLNSKIRPAIALLDEAIKLYDHNVGRNVEGAAFHQLQSTILILSRKESIDQYIEGLASGAHPPLDVNAALVSAGGVQPMTSSISAMDAGGLWGIDLQSGAGTQGATAPNVPPATEMISRAAQLDMDEFFGMKNSTELGGVQSVQPTTAELAVMPSVAVTNVTKPLSVAMPNLDW
ncbi:DUF3150 domain-containing protein [Comamonas jiangduensis]|uniref:DUF3150 domain-containing protein n=1 Tax=Comamonas jiangduensis TaxID=1194168 RepID=UPI003BF91F5C